MTRKKPPGLECYKWHRGICFKERREWNMYQAGSMTGSKVLSTICWAVISGVIISYFIAAMLSGNMPIWVLVVVIGFAILGYAISVYWHRYSWGKWDDGKK